jgi:hypothetical protein
MSIVASICEFAVVARRRSVRRVIVVLMGLR